MSYPQFGYSYPATATASSLSSQLLSQGNSLATTITPTTTGCETTPPPSGGNTQPSMYSTSAGLLSYPRVAGLADTVYSSAYATQGYVPFGADPSAFYSPLNADNTDAWRSLSGTTGWPYDPNSMAGYPYGTSYGGLDVRRKNATRESTSTLKAWLYEHIKNPYPTKGEKIMLAIITKMTLTQVSTWFANARRRLKKENKMQWSPRNRSGEDDDHKSDDEHDDGNGCDDGEGIHGNDPLRDNHQSNNNNNAKSLTDAGDVTHETDLSVVTTSNFNSLIQSDSSHKDLLGGSHSNHGTRGHHLLDNGADAFGNLRRDSEDPLHIRRDDDEDIVVDGGDSDPLSRLDFSGADHPLSHRHRLKSDHDIHRHHKLDTFDGSPLSQLSTPLGSPSHSLGDSLLSPLGVKGHVTTHCSSSNDVTNQHGGAGNDIPVGQSKGTQDVTAGVEGNKPRIWSIADVATSSTPPPGRRTPGITVNSSLHGLGMSLSSHHSALGLGTNKHSGLTAFSAPVSSTQAHSSSFQPWINGSYGGGTGHNNSGLSYNYPAINTHPSLAANSGTQLNVAGAVQRSDLNTHSLGGLAGIANNSPYSNKLSSTFLGDKNCLAQFSTGFTAGSDMSQTAFKPVAKRL